MKKTLDLLEEIVRLGYNREHALKEIDASLDYVIGFENRKPIDKEVIASDLYDDILYGFKCNQ